jgi:hypothetical protein
MRGAGVPGDADHEWLATRKIDIDVTNKAGL